MIHNVKLQFEITDDARLIVSAEDFPITYRLNCFVLHQYYVDIVSFFFFFFCFLSRAKNRAIIYLFSFDFFSLFIMFPNLDDVFSGPTIVFSILIFFVERARKKRTIINREINLKRKEEETRERERNRSLKQHVAISLCNRITQGELIYSLATCN